MMRLLEPKDFYVLQLPVQFRHSFVITVGCSTLLCFYWKNLRQDEQIGEESVWFRQLLQRGTETTHGKECCFIIGDEQMQVE